MNGDIKEKTNFFKTIPYFCAPFIMNMKKVNPILNKIIESLTKSFHRIMNMVTTITIDIQKVWGFISKLLF